MELTQLKYFQAAALEGNFTRAAKKANISQPALSKAILNLEDELGVKLFLRDGNRISLSHFGQILLEEVNLALLHLDTGVKNARVRAGLEQGHVSIAMSEAITITKPIEDFLSEYPNVYFQELPTSTLQMEESLLTGKVDFGITYEKLVNPKISWQALYQDRMSVLLHKDHPLAGRKEIELRELEGEHILQGDNFGHLSFVREMGEEIGFFPNIIYEGTDKSLVGRLVSKKIGIAFAPLSVSLGLDQEAHFPYEEGSVVYVPLKDDFWQKTIGIVSLAGRVTSQAAEVLRRRIIDYFHSLPAAENLNQSSAGGMKEGMVWN